jgi:hypothetical protein
LIKRRGKQIRSFAGTDNCALTPQSPGLPRHRENPPIPENVVRPGPRAKGDEHSGSSLRP